MRKTLAIIAAVASLSQAGAVQAGAYEDLLAGAEHDRTEVVLGFISLGLDPNTATVDGTTLLMIAARNGNLELLDALLQKRANHLIQNKYGDTALMIAALNGRLEVVMRLLELGGSQENRDGWAPLHYAAFGGHVDVARHLLGKGARVDLLAPNGQTALMLAAGTGKLEMVKLLIEKKADPSIRDSEGRTPRDMAAAKSHEDVARYLASVTSAAK